jgi:hypothetical protein
MPRIDGFDPVDPAKAQAPEALVKIRYIDLEVK